MIVVKTMCGENPMGMSQFTKKNEHVSVVPNTLLVPKDAPSN